MFGGKERREQAIKRLAEAVDAAAAALEADARPDLDLLDMVLERLSQALLDAPDNPVEIDRYDPDLDELFRQGWQLRQSLEKTIGAGELHDLARRTSPCAHCGSREIYVSDTVSIDTLAGRGTFHLPFRFAVCRVCGDVRMTVSDPSSLGSMVNAAGARVFRMVTVTAGDKDGPYR